MTVEPALQYGYWKIIIKRAKSLRENCDVRAPRWGLFGRQVAHPEGEVQPNEGEGVKVGGTRV